ncbi:YtxH domain-containing protein [Synechococcus elongatus]|uniref:YtxH domain-containing protein n=1 Tax=Synechococcus elongatus TaxID=32046 RepID=UPI0030D411B2
MTSSRDKFWSGVLLGATAGAIAALLTAPRRGKETRVVLQQSLEHLPEVTAEVAEKVQEKAERLGVVAGDRWGTVRGRLQQAWRSGVAAAKQEWQTTTIAAESVSERESSSPDQSAS